MKTIPSLLVVLVSVVVAQLVPVAVHAGEPGASRESLIKAEDLSWIGVSGSYETQDRDVENPYGWLLETQSFFALLHIDPMVKFLTLTVGGGGTEVKPGPRASYDRRGSMWLAGAKAYLWEYRVKDPVFMMSRVRIEGATTFVNHSAELLDQDMKWSEWRTSFLVSGEFFAENEGHELDMYPYSLTVMLGPVYSVIDQKSDDVLDAEGVPVFSFDQQNNWGLLLGADLQVAHNCYIGWETRTYDAFDNWTHDLHVGIHF